MSEKTLRDVAVDEWIRTGDWQAVADAVLAGDEARRWQGMESAPKDRRYILAWSPERRMAFQVVWDAEDKEWILIGQGDTAPEVTHWTPIPAPPQEVDRGA